MTELLRAIQNQGEAFEAYQLTNDERLKAIRASADDLREKAAHIESFQGRLETLEARASNPHKTVDPNSFEGEHLKRFISWMRKPDLPERKNLLQDMEDKGAIEKKDVIIGSGLSGGFAVPEEISRMIEKLELDFSPVRRLVKVVQTSTSDYKELVSLRGAGTGWVGETDTRSATATPTLREQAPTFGELYAYPQASEWSLDDTFFDVAGWLSEEIADQFAIAEGQAVIDGNGVKRPTGMLANTPSLAEDFGSPLRDADTYQYIASDTDIDASPSSPGVRMDSLIDLLYTVKSQYRVNANWVMNSTTAGAVRKLKTSDGVYLWQPNLIVGQPPLLLGYPVEIWEQMPSVGAGNFPIAFGNFRRAYVLANRVGLRITTDQVTTPGYVKFYVRRRVGGRPLNVDSVKFLRTID